MEPDTPEQLRALAERARRVAQGLTDQRAIAELEKTARNLETQADEMERGAARKA